MDLASASIEEAQAFVLILVRVGTLFMIAPILGHARVPLTVKAALALLVSLLILMALNAQGLQLPGEGGRQYLFPDRFHFLGNSSLAWRSPIRPISSLPGVQMAGQIVDIQIGFGLVNVIDPVNNDQVSILGEFYYLLAMLYFLALDGPHYLLRALADSYRLMPPGGLDWFKHATAIGPELANFFTKLFVISVQVAGPSVAVLFLSNLTMGLLAHHPADECLHRRPAGQRAGRPGCDHCDHEIHGHGLA